MARRANEALALVWERRITRHGRSRLSVAEFCSQEGVSPKSFYAWRRRLRGDEVRAARRGMRRPASRLFVPVNLPTPAIAAGGARIELPGGAVLSLPADAPLELVTAVIHAVLPSASRQERPTC